MIHIIIGGDVHRRRGRMSAGTIALASSLRSRPPEETLPLALARARSLGVVRVTDTTRLDSPGVPVFAAIRPAAVPGSLCVSAGKGLTAIEARVGACMEAVEMALAEPGRAGLPIVRARAGEILDGNGLQALIDLCPRSDAEPDPEMEIDCIAAADIGDGTERLVPAELVLYPYAASFFASDSNGLSSGNSLLEATVHGLNEVIERDIAAFQNVRDTSRLVRNETLPPPLDDLARRAAHLNIALYVRAAGNAFGLPYFVAALRDPGVRDGVHLGFGCHPVRAIAATRAVTEAFQTRLSLIHGGRDDLDLHLARFADLSERDRYQRFHGVADSFARDERPMSYEEVVDRAAEAVTLPAALELLCRELRRAGMSRVLRVTYTLPEEPLQVVRVIVPRLEFANHGSRRRGARLTAYLLARRRPPVIS